MLEKKIKNKRSNDSAEYKLTGLKVFFPIHYLRNYYYKLVGRKIPPNDYVTIDKRTKFCSKPA